MIKQNRQNRKVFKVYGLLRPDYPDPFYVWKPQPFYIGKGTRKRITEHRTEAKRQTGKQTIKFNIIHKLWDKGLDFLEIIFYDNLTEKEALSLEIRLIKLYGRINNGTGVLANLTDGGEGGSGAITDEETKKKLRILNKGKKLTQEHKDKIRKSHIGIKHTEETKQKMTGKNNHRFGKPLSPDHKKRLSETHSGHNHPMYGQHHTEYTKQKIRDTRKLVSEEDFYERNRNKRNRIEKEVSALIEKYKKEDSPFLDRKYNGISIVELKLKLLILFNRCGKSRSRIRMECGFCNYHFLRIPTTKYQHSYTIPTEEQWGLLKKSLGLSYNHWLDKYFITKRAH